MKTRIKGALMGLIISIPISYLFMAATPGVVSGGAGESYLFSLDYTKFWYGIIIGTGLGALIGLIISKIKSK